MVSKTRLDARLSGRRSRRSGACRITKVPCIGYGVLDHRGCGTRLTLPVRQQRCVVLISPLSEVTTRSSLALLNNRNPDRFQRAPASIHHHSLRYLSISCNPAHQSFLPIDFHRLRLRYTKDNFLGDTLFPGSSPSSSLSPKE